MVSAVTTRYTQDLAAPLSQILGDSTNTYVYGADRLYSTTGTRSWYTADALGSVRATLSDAGVVGAAQFFDPWGTPQNTLSTPFGFTGELQQGSNVYLRARWYNPSNGGFTARDPFVGYPETPYSLHYYQYDYANPMLLADPSGQCIGWVWQSGQCQFAGFDPRNWNYSDGGAYLAGLASNVTDPINGLYTLATNAQARTALWQQLRSLRPSDIPGMVLNGLVDPFSNLYQGVICDDSYMLGKGMGGVGLEVLGAAEGGSWLYGRRSPPEIGPVMGNWKPGRPGAPLAVKPASEVTDASWLRKIFGHPDSRHSPASLEGFVRRTLDGDIERYNDLINTLDSYLPAGTTVIVRGSTVNGYKWVNGLPFDRGVKPSDVDVVLLGDQTFPMWISRRTFGQQTDFVSPRELDWDWTAPQLLPLAQELESIFGRSVNIMGIRRPFFLLRQTIQQAPYLTLLEK